MVPLQLSIALARRSVCPKFIESQAITELFDGMNLFKMDFSWDGFESLILKVNGLEHLRTAATWQG